ncbi:vesicle-associated protein 2-1-like [Trifolium pratense]|uniref:Vesicle-associated protein 2-1-like n=1 Tax=Trifolium pratense TaxID=57577 RepID=A0A2K3P0I7_TRIPR|nr:vesicle-associated protein 2-1-like [Trifolium pratense]
MHVITLLNGHPSHFKSNVNTLQTCNVQSTIVAPNTDVDDLPADTFNKDSGNLIDDLELRFSYITTSPEGSSEDDARNSSQKLDSSSIWLFLYFTIMPYAVSYVPS